MLYLFWLSVVPPRHVSNFVVEEGLLFCCRGWFFAPAELNTKLVAFFQEVQSPLNVVHARCDV